MKEQYLKDGFDDYLAKPIDKEELNRILTKYLKKDSSKKTNEDNSNEQAINKALELLENIDVYNKNKEI